jgi:hypothetical protein
MLYVNETWYGSFLYIVDNIHAFYITSVIFSCMLGLEISVDAQSKILVVTFLVMLAADNTPSLLVYIYFLWKVFFLESGILSPLDDSFTVMVT